MGSLKAIQNFRKSLCLVILTLQTTATVLVMRYSRKVNEVGKDLYIGTTMTLMAELMKFILCLLVLALLESCSIAKSLLIFYFEVLKKPNETIKLLIPSSLYTIQNNLVITALSNLDAPTFQISYQIKIITTAVFSVLVLRKHINCMQWLALLILMLGVVFVQATAGQEPFGSTTINSHKFVGLSAVLVSSICSGFAGVFYEKLLKEGSQPSVLIRNLQMGIFSIFLNIAGVICHDYDEVISRGFFYGYSSIVWLVIMLQAFGGLLVAAVIKYADNILKGFATSISIIISCLVSNIILHDLELDGRPCFLLGTSMVAIATFLYGVNSHPATLSSRSETKSSETSPEYSTAKPNTVLPA